MESGERSCLRHLFVQPADALQNHIHDLPGGFISEIFVLTVTSQACGARDESTTYSPRMGADGLHTNVRNT
jgi:hypothetical protein